MKEVELAANKQTIWVAENSRFVDRGSPFVYFSKSQCSAVYNDESMYYVHRNRVWLDSGEYLYEHDGPTDFILRTEIFDRVCFSECRTISANSSVATSNLKIFDGAVIPQAKWAQLGAL